MLRTMKKLPSKLLKGPLSLTSFLFLLFLSTTLWIYPSQRAVLCIRPCPLRKSTLHSSSLMYRARDAGTLSQKERQKVLKDRQRFSKLFPKGRVCSYKLFVG